MDGCGLGSEQYIFGKRGNGRYCRREEQHCRPDKRIVATVTDFYLKCKTTTDNSVRLSPT